MLLLQLGMNVAGGPYQAIVSDYLPPERVGRASSWMSVYQFSGSVVGILLTTQLHGLALGVALAACLAAGWLATDLYVRTRPRAPAIAAAPLRLDANVRTVLASRAFVNLGFYTLFGFLFFFVRESLGAPDARTTTGILILAFTIAGVIGAAVAGRPADRIDKRLVVTVACIAIAISVGAFAAAPTVAVSLVCAIASGVAWARSSPPIGRSRTRCFRATRWPRRWACGTSRSRYRKSPRRDHRTARCGTRRAPGRSRPADRADLRHHRVRHRHRLALALAAIANPRRA